MSFPNTIQFMSIPIPDTYISREGRQYGPYTWEMLYAFGAERNLFPGDLIWSPGFDDWTPIEQIPHLSGFLPQTSTGKKSMAPLLFAIIIPAVVIIAVVAFWLLRSSNLRIREYYPKSGPAGSRVILEVSKKIDPEELKIVFGERTLAFTVLEENCFAITLPFDISSTEIQLIQKGVEVDSVPFTVLKPQYIPLHQEKLIPSRMTQTVKSKEGVSVKLPGGLIDKSRKLTISKVVNPEVPVKDPFSTMDYYDITIEGLTQLSDTIEIGLPYNPEDLDPALPLADNFEPAYWDEEQKKWVDLFYRVDDSTRTVYMITDHLCVTIPGLAGAGAAAVIVGGTVGEIGERLLNDKYISRDKKVRILYSDAELQKAFPNTQWEARIAPAKLHTGTWYDPKISYAVQDFGHILDVALASYMREGFADPTVKTVWGNHIYTRYVKVKIDSWYNAGGEMSHDTFWDQINVPTYLINAYFFDTTITKGDSFESCFTRLKALLSHELFHVIQRPYYSIMIALMQSPQTWWREATAEWASLDLAKIPDRSGWKKDAPQISTRIGPDFLDYPLNTRGTQKGSFKISALDYEYLNAIFVRYLVRQKGFSIKELITTMALDSGSDPLVPLRKYVRRKTGASFDLLFADYANWFLKSTQLPLSDFANPGNTRIAASRSDTVIIEEMKAPIKIYQTCNEDDNFHRISIFKISGGQEHITPEDTPVLRLDDCFPETREIEVENGDHLYFVVPNGTITTTTTGLTIQTFNGKEWENALYETVKTNPDGTAKVLAVKISSEALTIEPKELENAKTGEEYTFEIEAIGLPENIKEVTFAYDFGDKQKDSTGKKSMPVEDGEARFSLPHTYQPVPNLKETKEPIKYTLSVEMLHAGKKRLSGSAEVTIAPVELVVMPRHSVGPPGATFDMEAYARPEATYKYQWEMEGEADVFVEEGKTSSIAPALEKKGEFFVTVKLFDLEGNHLATDRVTVEITEEEIKAPEVKEEPEEYGRWILTRTWQEKWEDDSNNKDKIPITLSGNSFTYSRTFQDLTDAFSFDYAGSWSAMPESVPNDTVMETTLQIDSVKLTTNKTTWGVRVSLNSGWDRFKNDSDTPKPDWMSHGWSFKGFGVSGEKDLPEPHKEKWSLSSWPDDGAKQIVTIRVMAYSTRSFSVAHTYYEYTFKKN